MGVALINGRVLGDAGFEEGRVVVLNAGRIETVLDHEQWQAERSKQTVYDLKGQRLVPGFVDTQVNGGGGVLFNDDPSVDSIVEIGRAHRRYGTTGFLPTLISDDLDVVLKAVRAVQTAMEIGVPGLLGIHIEGPFLNEER
jgi:N-acetylglucosamine-6-phosphate deacetylase